MEQAPDRKKIKMLFLGRVKGLAASRSVCSILSSSALKSFKSCYFNEYKFIMGQACQLEGKLVSRAA